VRFLVFHFLERGFDAVTTDNRVEFHRFHWTLISRLLVNHSKEICRCVFDIKDFGLASPALGGEDTAAMYLIEIAVGQFVVPSSVFAILVVYPQEPLAILEEAIPFDEFFFGLCGGMVVAPRLSLVVDPFTFLDKSLGVSIRTFIELNGHVVYRLTAVRLENRRHLPHYAARVDFYRALAVVPVRRSALRLRAAIRPSMPSFLRIAANSERRVATSLIAPSR